jgi:predicted ATPase
MGRNPTFANGRSWAEVGICPIPARSLVRYFSEVVIPESLRCAVLDRIRTMDHLERGVVLNASVIGRRFDFDVLLATTRCTRAKVRLALRRAAELQLIVAEGRAGVTYSFRHALTRDIIYAECMTLKLRPLHRRIIRALERVGRADAAALPDLAYHAAAAGDARRSRRYNELAGDNAAVIHALEDAHTFYARARSLTGLGSRAYARLTEKLRATAEARAADDA